MESETKVLASPLENVPGSIVVDVPSGENVQGPIIAIGMQGPQTIHSESGRPGGTIQFKKLHPDAIVPTRGTPHSAGFDLYALEDTLIVGGAGNVLVPTGIAVQLPPDTYGRIAMRSGLAIKEHLNISGGVIDKDYAGPLGVIVCSNEIFDVIRTAKTELRQLSTAHAYVIKKGERFAQLIPEKISYDPAKEVTEFDQKYDEHKGYGSTGIY
jgi:dUTP pyrophosphatase